MMFSTLPLKQKLLEIHLEFTYVRLDFSSLTIPNPVPKLMPGPGILRDF